MATKMGAGSAGPAGGREPAYGAARVAMAAALGLVVAIVIAMALPATAFRARAVVAIVDVTSPLAVLLPRAAADAAVSEPVMRRAAESLIGTDVAVPEPTLAEKLSVAVGLDGAHATGRAARLAFDLAQTVTATPGELPGALDIAAQSADPERAAQIATAVADALVADQDEVVVQTRRKRDVTTLALVERLKGDATAARQRLAALGGVEADPAQIYAAAAAQTANAQARVDTIRAIIASGTPPLSDRRDVPTAIETLQTTYLDLSRQLAKARETLGDRHTIVVSLQGEAKHAAANLTTEWRRLEHLADAELTSARTREAMVHKADTPADATRRGAIDEARRTVQIADEATARAQTVQRATADDERSYHLLARAAIPTVASGFPVAIRSLLSGLAGLLAFAVALRLPHRRAAQREAETDEIVQRSAIQRDAIETATIQPETSHQPKTTQVKTTQSKLTGVPPRQAAKRSGKIMRNAREAVVAPDADLMQSLADLLPNLESFGAAYGTVPTVMVAANELGAGTMPVALALGRVAVEIGHRVLLVETARSRPELATAADPEADPVLIDLYGTLRVALPAATTDGFLYLVPSLEHGARIASALARHGDTPLVDDLTTEFDLIVIDGGRAADSAAEGWSADVFVRVGRFASQRDDGIFAASFGVATEELLGTIVASVFPPKPPRKPLEPQSRFGAPTRAPEQHAPAAPASYAPSPMTARRKVGTR